MKGESHMKFILFFSLNPETVHHYMVNPGDRVGPVKALLKTVGGTLESYYWMLGPYDGFVIAQVPDAKAIAAVSMAVGSTGAFRRLESYELLEPGDLEQIARLAHESSAIYRPPGD